MIPHHRKKRPFKSKQAHHVVLSCTLPVFHQSRVRQIADSTLKYYANYFGVKIYHRAAVGSHMHLILLPKSAEGFASFLRVVTGQISAKLRRLGVISKTFKEFWKSRPWSRVLSWGRNYTIATRYVALNYLESKRLVRRYKAKHELRVFAKLIDEVLNLKLTNL